MLRVIARYCYEVGRSFQRTSGFMLLAALVGLPLAVLLPNRPGLVLICALGFAGLIRLARHSAGR